MIKKIIRRIKLTIILFNMILKGDAEVMVDVYCTLIIVGKRTFASVPAKLKDAVRENLAAMGLNENGDPMEA